MYNLIIVEDEKIVRTALEEYITETSRDFTICGSFSNGEDALHYVQKHRVDIVLTDIKMNKMDGLTLCCELHQNFPHCHAIIISGFSTFDYAKKALQYGVKNYLLKPIDFKELTDCLNSVRKSLDAEIAFADSAEEDAALFFTELVSGSMKSPKQLDEQISRLNLPFLSDDNNGCVLRLSLCANDYASTWRYEKDRLPYTFANILRMKLKNVYVNNFFSTGSYSYYIVIFLDKGLRVCPQELEEDMLELLHIKCNITFVCHFANLTHLSTQRILENLSTSPEDSNTDENTVIRKIKDYINQNYYKDISRQELADMFYFSTAYFSRFFKKETGLNFIDYLTTTRMEKAIELLNSRTSIDEIARKVGYKSRNHFILNFRQYTSMSPTEYRKQILKLK
ncbi:MAG: response regulator [Lachnospiraceae bacterium]|nr:response regulator [Lachnospiraceae bacterium]